MARQTASTKIAAIGIGASAGGIHSLQRLLADLPADFPLLILVVQHLAPDHKSQLAEVLDRITPLTVRQAQDRTLAEPGTVYVAPPDHHLLLGPGGGLHLTHSEKIRYARPSVDVLFESLARNSADKAIAVILSGKGSDGADGALAVHRAGGNVIVEDPASTEHDQMPAAALRLVPEAIVLPLNQIAAKLSELVVTER